MAGTEGGVSLDVTPNAKDFWRLLDAQLKPGSKNAGDSVGKVLTKAIADAAAPAAKRFAATFKTRLRAELKDFRPTVTVDLDSKRALAQIAEIDDMLKGLSEVHIDVGVDTADTLARLEALEAELDRLKAKADKPVGGGKSKGGGFLGGIAKDASLARIALIGLGPAAIPVLGAIAAAAAPLAATLAATGIATAGFGVVAKAVFGDVLDAQKKLKTAQDAYNNATTKAGKSDALKQQKAILDGLTGSQRKLLTATNATESAWTKTKKSLAAPVANGLTPWMSAARKGMTVLKPLITPVSLAIHDLGVSVDKYLGNKKNLNGVKDFAASVGHLGAVALRQGVDITKNVLQGLYKLVKDFGPVGHDLGDTAQTLAKRFNAWAGSAGPRSGIQHFLDEAKKNGPQIRQVLKDVAAAVANLAKAGTGFGPSALSGVSLLAKLTAGMSPKTIQTIAVAWLGVASAQKAIKVGSGIKDSVQSAKDLASGAGKARDKLKDLKLAEKGLSAAGKFKDAGTAALNASKNVGKLAGSYLLAGTRAAAAAVKTVAFKVAQVAVAAATKIWAAVQWILNVALSANPIGLIVIAIALLVAAIIIAWKHSKTFRDIVTGAFNAVKKAVTVAVGFVVDFVKRHWKLLLGILGGPIIAAVLLITSNWGKIKRAFKAGIDWVSDKWHSLWSGVVSTAKRLGSSVTGAVKSMIGKVKGAFKAGVEDVKSIWNGLKKAVSAPIRWVIDKVINHGILWAWDSIAKLLHLDSKLQIPYLPLPFKDGGIVNYYANGGVENHTAQIAPAGAMRVWAEPETGGEAYIPLASNKRGRSTQILGAVADSFGYKLMPFADGGVLGWLKKTAGKGLGAIEGLGKAALNAISDPAKWILDKLTKPVRSLLGKVGNSNFAKAGVSVGEKALSAMAGALKSLLGQYGGGGSSAMVSLARTQLGYHEGAGNSNKYSHALGRPSEEWCFAAGTLVDTPAGPVPIETLNAGDLVVSMTGAPCAVLVTNRRNAPESLVIKAPGVDGTRTTPGHPYWTPDGWVNAGDLRPGDQIDVAPTGHWDDGHGWVQITSVTPAEGVEVFNITVADEHTFIADGAAVHNCADFIDWLAVQTKNKSAVPMTASAPGMARAFGSKYHAGTSGAQPGDVVFFGPSKAGIYHVGLASGAGGSGSVPTIAGNSSNMVRSYTGTGVAGYAHPNYPNPGSVGSTGGLVHASPGVAKEWARQNLKNYGWGQSQYSPLERLWTRESGWRWNALNRSSGAYGIPQSLPASKMRSAGSDWHDNAGTQVKWGLGYINSRYGSPSKAWGHSQSTGWYDSAGYMPPGYSISYNGTGRPERLFTKHQTDLMGRGRGGDGAALIDTVNLQLPQGATPQEMVHELDFSLRQHTRGGKYGG